MAFPSSGAKDLSTYQVDPYLATETRVPQIIVGTLIPTILASIFALARFYARGVLTKNWGIDDYLILIAWIFSIVLAVTNCVFTKYGLGHHTLNLSSEYMVPSLKLGLANQLIYQFVLYTSRAGLCFFYLRIFQDRPSTVLIYTLLVCMIVVFIPIEFATIFRCKPVDYAWNPYHLFDKKSCGNRFAIIWASAVGNILGDAALMIFVLPRLTPLKLPRRDKWSILFIVGLGHLVIATAIVRLVRLLQNGDSVDSTWTGYDIAIWSSVEISTSTICASAPCIRPVLRKVAPGLMASNEAPNLITPSFVELSQTRPYTVPRFETRKQEIDRFESESIDCSDLFYSSVPRRNTDLESRE